MKLLIVPMALALAAGAHAAPATVKVNQLGFDPAAAKFAVVPGDSAKSFEVVRAENGETVLRGKLGKAAAWEPSEETVQLADFSALDSPGRYRIKVPGMPASDMFTIGATPYRYLNIAALRAFYLQRASIDIPAKHAGPYARPLAHPDDKVLIHASAASKARPAGTVVASPKGWYDAGDYNKYVVNSGISTYTLLAAYEHYPAYFAKHELNIPESNDSVPDILDEAKWNLDWMLTMQDPNDGGVYFKLTNKVFDGMVMPHKVGKAPRYMVGKSTSSALDFAATMATASRIYRQHEQQFPGLSGRMLVAAESAWKWAQANPNVQFKNPPDIKTGEYGDNKLADERAWAAAELYITTGKDSYWTAMKASAAPATVPNWSDVAGLPWISLAHHLPRLTPAADRKLITSRIDGVAARLAAQWKSSAYKVAMQRKDFGWGSNAEVLNQSMMLLQAYRLGGKREYLDAAQSGMDFVLGRNALGYSFVTGFGSKQVMHVHHRPSAADGITEPWPGLLSGGPQPKQQDADDCPVKYPSKVPALSFIDHACSYASNEIAINWNAPLVYVSAALDALSVPLTDTNKQAGAAPKMDNKEVSLDTIRQQEELLQFTAFNNDVALEIGNKIIELAKAAKKSVAIDITLNGTQVFFYGMPGTDKGNADWIRRKSNLVNRTGHASFYVHTEAKAQGKDFDNLPGFDKADYAAHGGSFPVVVKGTGRVGTITVSGLPGAEDHAMVINALKWYLKVDV